MRGGVMVGGEGEVRGGVEVGGGAALMSAAVASVLTML